ncbi:putative efflux transporter [Guyanagaster necrorhizus]|uniref:Efflux transporter n=1 Tax=Guyanagaster necrorhizus TaxID=856835 RepID=A0A9P7VPW5_9AGAR|nr:putative efflux transporter [Guyanagaster necrorhizus MCA 3950]KAG7444587.1 putative efflux transporter [Guyanagaster necrorhizus MCA 3950]
MSIEKGDKNEAEQNFKVPPIMAVPTQRSSLRSVLIVATCTIAMIVNQSNSTAVSISLPTIGDDLGIPEAKLNWIVSAYPLSSGCLLVLFGRIADLYGRKRMFCVGSLWLAAFSLGCSFSKDAITLDILRAFQGIGAAATIPASIGILAHAFPPSRARSIAFATFAAGAPLGGAFGLAIGGVLTQLTKRSWRSPFYLSAGVCAASFVMGLVVIDADLPSTETDQRIDWIGGFLVTVGLVLIVFVLSQGEVAPQQWKTPYIIALLIVGVIFVAAFLYWQYHLEKQLDDPSVPKTKWNPPPLMRLSLWTRAKGRVAVMMTVAFLQWCGFLAWCYWAQLYYQNYKGYTPLLTVIRLLPMCVSGITCNVIVAALVGRLPLVWFMAIGTGLTSVAPLLFGLINPNATYWAFGFPAAIVAVVGADFVFAGGTLFIAKVSLPHEQSLAGGVFQTMTQLGTSVGVTVSTVVFDRVLRQRSADMGVILDANADGAPKAAQLDSYKAAEWTNFSFGVLATILALIFFRGVGVVGQHRKQIDDQERTVTDPISESKT